MIRAAKRIADRMVEKFVPAAKAEACADVCVEYQKPDGTWCYCASPCRPAVCVG